VESFTLFVPLVLDGWEYGTSYPILDKLGPCKQPSFPIITKYNRSASGLKRLQKSESSEIRKQKKENLS